MNSIGEGDEDDKGSSTFDLRNSEKNGTTRSQSDHLQSKMVVSSSRREVDKLTQIKPLNDLLLEIEVDKECERKNFTNKKVMKQYIDDDYKIKKYLRLVTLG